LIGTVIQTYPKVLVVHVRCGKHPASTASPHLALRGKWNIERIYPDMG
jgi:hypothetical protein